jgi:hypothetical protein
MIVRNEGGAFLTSGFPKNELTFFLVWQTANHAGASYSMF